MYYRLKGPGTEAQRNTRKITLLTAKARSISKVRKRDGKPNGGVTAQKTYWRGAAHSNSEDSIRRGKHARREKIKTKVDLALRGRNGRVRDFAAVDASVKCKAVWT